MFIFTLRRQRVTSPENKIKPECQRESRDIRVSQPRVGIILMVMGRDLGIKSFPVISQR